MDKKEHLRVLLRTTTALQGAMRESVSSATGDYANTAKYASFRTFMNKYNLIVNEAAPLLRDSALLDKFDLTKMGSSGSYMWPQQKEAFDLVFTNVTILKSLLEGAIGFAEDATQTLKDFIQANLRRAVYEPPQRETEIQNSIEILLIGRGIDRKAGQEKQDRRT